MLEIILQILSPIGRAFIDNNSPIYCFFSFIASIVTIAGFYSIWSYCQKISISKQCQEKIIIDLIRHFFINCVIVEIIRARVTKEKFAVRPTDGVFSRFAVLDTDMRLERFSVDSQNFETIHKINMLFRNYNIVAGVAEKHFADPTISDHLKIQVLNELFFRAVKATNLLFKLSRCLKLGVDEKMMAELLKGKSEKSETAEKKADFVELATNGLWPAGIDENDILPRNAFRTRSYSHSYYDDEPLALTTVFNESMLQHATSFYFIPVHTDKYVRINRSLSPHKRIK
ncbi:MAG: hypothetical protein NC250_01495 [Alistipes senegalensis]|nr:hypothetical protein [Bacteroides cellulosilyticus]MCM1351390.1 hypothetical protein [Alistipes senegalensis]